MLKRLASLCLMTSVLLLTGCVTIGPKVEKKTVFVRTTDAKGRPMKIGRVAENVKVKLDVETSDGDITTQSVDIGGWAVTPPEVDNVPAPAKEESK